jgi:hypothetical protein
LCDVGLSLEQLCPYCLVAHYTHSYSLSCCRETSLNTHMGAKVSKVSTALAWQMAGLPTANIWSTRAAHTEHTQSTHSAHTVHTQCTLQITVCLWKPQRLLEDLKFLIARVHSNLQCALCVHCVCTVCALCVHCVCSVFPSEEMRRGTLRAQADAASCPTLCYLLVPVLAK